MEIDVKLFLLANAVILGAIMFSYSSGKRRQKNKPSKLNMKGFRSSSTSPVVVDMRASHRRQRDRSKALNVMFEFNGEQLDAYQVLQVPAGASFQQVEESYRKLFSVEKDSAKKQMYFVAFEAVQKGH